MKNSKKNNSKFKSNIAQWQLYQQLGKFSVKLNKALNLSEIKKDVRKVAPLQFVEMII